MMVNAYIHSLKDKTNDCNISDKAEILQKIGENLYIAKYHGIRCTAIYNYFDDHYYVDDVYVIIKNQT